MVWATKKSVILGGISALSGFSGVEESKIKSDLLFRKFEYVDGTNRDLNCCSVSHTPTKKYLIVPRNYPYLSGISWDYVYRTALGRRLPSDYVLKKTLGWEGAPDQPKFVDSICSGLRQNLTGFGIAGCGTGKTLMGLEISRRLGLSTLIIVPRKVFIEQWISELRDSFDGIPSYGVYHGTLKNIPEKTDLMFACSNSVIKCDASFFKNYGTVIFDECHGIPADSLVGKLLPKIKSHYILGLTAELYRSDNLEKMFESLLGKVLYHMPSQEVSEIGTVYQLLLPYRVTVYARGKVLKSQWAKALSNNNARNECISKIIYDCFRNKRNLFVYSEIKEHLRKIMVKCIEKGIPENLMGYYFGGMSDSALQESLKKPITFSTYRMGKMGVNAPWKDALLCATPPPANVRQLTGRVTRKIAGVSKPDPIIYDLVDGLSTALLQQAKSRIDSWEREKFQIKKICWG